MKGRGLRWRWRKSDEFGEDHIRGWVESGAVSGGAGDGDFLQGLAAGSGAANVDEQFGSGSGGEAGRTGGVWGNGKSGAQLGMFSRDCEIAARIGERRN